MGRRCVLGASHERKTCDDRKICNFFDELSCMPTRTNKRTEKELLRREALEDHVLSLKREGKLNCPQCVALEREREEAEVGVK